MPPDPRCHPLIELDRATVEAMVAPLARGAALREVERVDGGLTNTMVRVTTADGATFALRVYAAGRAAFDLERGLLPRLAGALPVPRVRFADAGNVPDAHPYLVYRWIEGITLNECRRQVPPPTLATLAEPLGRLLARVAGHPAGRDLLRGHPDASRLERRPSHGSRCGLRGRTSSWPADRRGRGSGARWPIACGGGSKRARRGWRRSTDPRGSCTATSAGGTFSFAQSGAVDGR